MSQQMLMLYTSQCMQKGRFLYSHPHKIHKRPKMPSVAPVCVCLGFQFNLYLVHCTALGVCVCVFVSVHERPRMLSPDYWPCNLFDIVSLGYPCCPSPMTWLPGNRNGVPHSLKAKCTSMLQRLQPMSSGGGGRGGKAREKR